MNNTGDAAEQIVRMSLDGVELAARITGTAAKEIALLLMAALKSPDKGAGGRMKLKGKARLNSMLKSGKALEIFSIKEGDLRTFVREAKRYGIVYCVLRNSKHSPDGLCDVMVKADDAPKINRLVERFEFATVDRATIESEIVQDIEAKAAEAPAGQTAPEGAQPGEPEINDADKLVDDLLGSDEGKAAPEAGKEGPIKAETDKTAPDAPDPAKTAPKKPAPKKTGRENKKGAPVAGERKEDAPLASGGRNSADTLQPPKTSPSGHSSGNRKKSENPISSKPSVKEELREITAAKKAKEAELKRGEAPAPDKEKKARVNKHKQPKNVIKAKSRKAR